jgi:hypothetical protein
MTTWTEQDKTIVTTQLLEIGEGFNLLIGDGYVLQIQDGEIYTNIEKPTELTWTHALKEGVL